MDITVTDYIRTVPDYPAPGINFYDMNSLFASEVWGVVVENLAKQIYFQDSELGHVTHIVGIESRGFAVGGALAHEMLKPFVMVRKAGAKYPGDLLSESYDTEYSTDTLTLQQGLLGHTSRVLIVDDLVATGGSMLATKRLVEQTGARVLGGVTVVNLTRLNSSVLKEMKIFSAQEILT